MTLLSCLVSLKRSVSNNFVFLIGASISPIATCSTTLEAAGAGIMQQKPIPDIGKELVSCAEGLLELSVKLQAYAPDREEAQLAGQRMAYAADRMKLAGTELQGTTEKPKAGKKSWLKGG